jgi:hypothetical protein
MKIKIPHSDRCDHCGHPSCDDAIPFVIISKERFDWLMQAAQMVYDSSGDDDWVDWMDEHKDMVKRNQ